jgi:hypothetical protein
MKLPTIKTILREDLKDAPAWVDNLITPINTFMREVYYGLDKQLTLQENVVSVTKELTFTTSPTYSTGTFETINIPFSNSTTVNGVLLLKVANSTGSTITSPTSVAWVSSNGGVSITYVAGLANSNTYTAKFLII